MSAELLEKLAANAHDCWANWMKHLFTVEDRPHRDGWRRQMDTPYDGLSEHEKQSDRDVVLKYQKPALDLIDKLQVDSDQWKAIAGRAVSVLRDMGCDCFNMSIGGGNPVPMMCDQCEAIAAFELMLKGVGDTL